MTGSASAEILYREGDAGGKPGHKCQHEYRQHGDCIRVQQEPAGSVSNVIDVGFHALHSARSQPEDLLGMAPEEPLEP